MRNKLAVSSEELERNLKGGETDMRNKLAVRRKELIRNLKGGERVMRRLIAAVFLVGLVSGIASALVTDSVILTITPSFNLSVNISSETHTFGPNVDLGTTRTICVGQLENDGNVSSKWQKTTPSQTGTVGTVWSLISGNGTDTGKDNFKLLVVATGALVAPDLTSTDTTNRCIKGDHSIISAPTGSYTDLTEGGSASPMHPKSETRKLWVSLLMPTNITTGNQQTITLSVQAVTQ